jgi:hypothetical protein
LTGPLPSGLADLKQLVVLNVHGNDLSGKVPSLLFHQYTHCLLDNTPDDPGIEHNSFSCPLPADAAAICNATCS